ncbi:NUDIX domain-containing protein [Vineibacter terrae]|uniref:ADP-ribose pyrophosphatase n=1 Tax=Vineibacter terrae TaxID=2586908 RepID=A0A5C8PV28_9HYPH|nr:NUDIX domain-containing protein [Vineibacter terrae]TXL81710.1 NUDIX domain-containing protein [Vineibacter terrae]
MADAPPDEKVVSVTRRVAFQGYFRIGEYRFRHSLFQGGVSGEIKREVFERGHAAAVLPYDPVLDRVVLVRQFRAGAYAAGRHPWLWETVAGIIEEGETAEDVVRREAQEEAGLELGALLPVHTWLNSPGGASETTAGFCGRVDARGAGGVHGLPDEGEDILVRSFTLDEAKALLASGEVGSATGIVILQWLLLNRDFVRSSWT